MNLKIARAIFCLAAAASAVRADVKETAQKLTGATSQNWVAERIETVMGTGGCTKGETWRFNANQSVEIRKCVSGKIDKQTLNWSLKEESSLDTVITIDYNQYYITFYKKAGANWMQLKGVPNSKTDPRINREFRLADE
jgi:hypothetical protein